MKLKYLIPIIGIMLAWSDFDQVEFDHSNGKWEHKNNFFNVVVAFAATILFTFGLTHFGVTFL